MQDSPIFSELAWEIVLNFSMLPDYVVFLETWEADYFWGMSLRADAASSEDEREWEKSSLPRSPPRNSVG